MSQIEPEVSQIRDYERVARAIAFIATMAPKQPPLAEVAREMGLSLGHAQRLFTRWAGISPKQFLRYLTHSHARELLRERATVLETAYEVGLSGPGRLHDLTLSLEAMSPGEIKCGGKGVVLRYGFHDSPFGRAVIVATARGLAGLAFADAGGEAKAWDDMRRRWPHAEALVDNAGTADYAKMIFGCRRGDVTLVLAGTPFQLKVWEALLSIPAGQATSYSRLAAVVGAPTATRAVATAVGRNPIAYLIPCHRVLQQSGALGGYHWGEARKRAMLAWESAAFGHDMAANHEIAEVGA